MLSTTNNIPYMAPNTNSSQSSLMHQPVNVDLNERRLSTDSSRSSKSVHSIFAGLASEEIRAAPRILSHYVHLSSINMQQFPFQTHTHQQPSNFSSILVLTGDQKDTSQKILLEIVDDQTLESLGNTDIYRSPTPPNINDRNEIDSWIKLLGSSQENNSLSDSFISTQSPFVQTDSNHKSYIRPPKPLPSISNLSQITTKAYSSDYVNASPSDVYNNFAPIAIIETDAGKLSNSSLPSSDSSLKSGFFPFFSKSSNRSIAIELDSEKKYNEKMAISTDYLSSSVKSANAGNIIEMVRSSSDGSKGSTLRRIVASKGKHTRLKYNKKKSKSQPKDATVFFESENKDVPLIFRKCISIIEEIG